MLSNGSVSIFSLYTDQGHSHPQLCDRRCLLACKCAWGMILLSACTVVRADAREESRCTVSTVTVSPYYFNPQVSVLPDDSHPKQGTSPKEGGLKNGDIEGYFGQLKLDDKGQYKNVLCHCQETVRFKILVPIRGTIIHSFN